jgi:hypothetical protein
MSPGKDLEIQLDIHPGGPKYHHEYHKRHGEICHIQKRRWEDIGIEQRDVAKSQQMPGAPRGRKRQGPLEPPEVTSLQTLGFSSVRLTLELWI